MAKLMTRGRWFWLIVIYFVACATVCILGFSGLLSSFQFANRQSEIEQDSNFTQIEDKLYMGGFISIPPRGTQSVLNLCEWKDNYEVENHVWHPIRDAVPPPTISWLHEQVEFVEAQQKQGKTTYVHCFNGVSRAGTVITAYEMHKNSWTRDQALEFVRSKRPNVRPNPAFMTLLLEWERAIMK